MKNFRLFVPINLPIKSELFVGQLQLQCLIGHPLPIFLVKICKTVRKLLIKTVHWDIILDHLRSCSHYDGEFLHRYENQTNGDFGRNFCVDKLYRQKRITGLSVLSEDSSTPRSFSLWFRRIICSFLHFSFIPLLTFSRHKQAKKYSSR